MSMGPDFPRPSQASTSPTTDLIGPRESWEGKLSRLFRMSPEEQRRLSFEDFILVNFPYGPFEMSRFRTDGAGKLFVVERADRLSTVRSRNLSFIDRIYYAEADPEDEKAYARVAEIRIGRGENPFFIISKFEEGSSGQKTFAYYSHPGRATVGFSIAEAHMLAYYENGELTTIDQRKDDGTSAEIHGPKLKVGGREVWVSASVSGAQLVQGDLVVSRPGGSGEEVYAVPLEIDTTPLSQIVDASLLKDPYSAPAESDLSWMHADILSLAGIREVAPLTT